MDIELNPNNAEEAPEKVVAKRDVKTERGYWVIKKFREETWNQRFANLVEPTFEIAQYLWWHLFIQKERERRMTGAQLGTRILSTMLGSNAAQLLKKTIFHFKTTGAWRPCLKDETEKMQKGLRNYV